METVNRFWRLLARVSGGCVRTHGAANGGTIYLTFDDGPHPEHTPPLLGLLAEHGARATFFLIGDAARRWPELVRRIRAEGHSIGNHSMSHVPARPWRVTAHGRAIDEAEKTLDLLDGPRRRLYRPPFGRLSLGAMLACMRRRLPVMLWSIDSLDYRLAPQDVVRRLREQAPAAGDVILLHDDHPCACQALSILLPEWRSAGMRLDALR